MPVDMEQTEVVAVVLAAGLSRRMGPDNKLLLPVAEQPMVRHVVQAALASRCAKEEGIFAGISTGASLAAINTKLPDMPDGSRILTFCYDTGERYLSVPGLFE